MKVVRVLGLDLSSVTMPEAIAAMVDAWLDAQESMVRDCLNQSENDSIADPPPPGSINATKGSELIEAQTGRRCSRQNLDKICRIGALKGSPCILRKKPLRLDPDLLVSEYLANVRQYQIGSEQPRARVREVLP